MPEQKKEPLQTALLKEETGLSRMSWVAEALSFPFTGSVGQRPVPEKQPHSTIPPPQTGNIFLSIRRTKTARQRGIIWQSVEHISLALEHRGIVLYSTPRLTSCLVMQGLRAASQPWTAVLRSSQHTVFLLMLKPEDVLDASEIDGPILKLYLVFHAPIIQLIVEYQEGRIFCDGGIHL